jgi:2-polyprenyl-3-methyl-5-hydroxy-6-metoxy-1,4-benzoquinol methylase
MTDQDKLDSIAEALLGLQADVADIRERIGMNNSDPSADDCEPAHQSALRLACLFHDAIPGELEGVVKHFEDFILSSHSLIHGSDTADDIEVDLLELGCAVGNLLASLNPRRRFFATVVATDHKSSMMLVRADGCSRTDWMPNPGRLVVTGDRFEITMQMVKP